MGIEKITSAILDEAASESEQIINAARTKSRGAVNDVKKRIEIETQVAVDEAAEEKEKIIARRRSVADIDSKKIVLGCKQELINKCFDDAIERITSMEEGKYVDFLTSLGKASGFADGALIFNKKEREAIGQKVVAALNKAVKDGRFELSAETRDLKGGYMLRRGQIYINNSVEAVVEDKRRQLTGDVAAILFPPEN